MAVLKLGTIAPYRYGLPGLVRLCEPLKRNSPPVFRGCCAGNKARATAAAHNGCLVHPPHVDVALVRVATYGVGTDRLLGECCRTDQKPGEKIILLLHISINKFLPCQKQLRGECCWADQAQQRARRGLRDQGMWQTLRWGPEVPARGMDVPCAARTLHSLSYTARQA